MFKKGEILLLNSEMKTMPFRDNGCFQDVTISQYGDENNVADIVFHMKNVSLFKKGFPLEPNPDNKTSSGEMVDYSKVKLVVIESLSRVIDMMFDYCDAGNNSRDKRNVYGDFQQEFTKFIRRCLAIPVPKIWTSLATETQDDKAQLWKCAYVQGNKLKKLVESYFTIVLFSDPDRYKVNTSEKYRFQTNDTNGNIAKTPMGMFEETYIPNDMEFVIKKALAYYGKKFEDNFRFPDILLTGDSGSGKSTSFRNLVKEE